MSSKKNAPPAKGTRVRKSEPSPRMVPLAMALTALSRVASASYDHVLAEVRQRLQTAAQM